MGFYLQIWVGYLLPYLRNLYLYQFSECFKEVPGTDAPTPWSCKKLSRQFSLLIFKVEWNPCNLAAGWTIKRRCVSGHITHRPIRHVLPQPASHDECRESAVSPWFCVPPLCRAVFRGGRPTRFLWRASLVEMNAFQFSSLIGLASRQVKRAMNEVRGSLGPGFGSVTCCDCRQVT